MNDDFFEKLSALHDGELAEFETRQLLRQLDQLSSQERDAVYKRWQQMQTISAAMQKEALSDTDPVLASTDFVGRVASVLDAELDQELDQNLDQAQGQAQVSVSDQQNTAAHHQVHHLADKQTQAVNQDQKTDTVAESAPLWSRLALVASVALAVVVGVQQYQLGEQQQRLLSAGNYSEQGDQTQAALLADLKAAQSEEEQLAAQQRLLRYLQQREQLVVPGAATDPFVRTATFEEPSPNRP